MIDPVFFDHDDNPVGAPVLDWSLTWDSHKALGGFDQANLVATGSWERLWELRRLLGRFVTVYDDIGDIIWCGLVESIYWQKGVKYRGLSLRDMANRVAVAYTVDGVTGYTRATTDWVENTESVNHYGRKELLVTASDVNAAAAAAKAVNELAQRSKPLASFEATDGQGAPSATLACIGLHHTLDWQYYANSAGQETHQGSESADLPLGIGFTSSRIGFTGGHIHDLDGNLTLPGPDLGVTVTGSASNNGTYTSGTQSTREAKSYTASTIFFNASDDIHDDTGEGLGFIDTDDYIEVSGAATGANNGIKKATSASATHVTVNPSTIVTASAGPAITISRGTKIAINETLTNEFPGSAVTLTVHGTKLFQMFQLATNEDWSAAEISIRVQRVGNPTDSLKVSLVTVANNQPGNILDSGTVIGSNVTEEMADVTFTLSNSWLMNPTVQYGILVERTGANSSANYYLVETDNLGTYARGALRLWTGSGWVDSTKSLHFRVSGAQETTTQIERIVTDSGQFVVGVDIQTTSGISTNQYRDGDRTALEELQDLIAIGISGGQRLLWDVTPQRILRIYAQPASQERDWVLDDDGQVRDNLGRVVRGGRQLAGRWIQSDDIPAAVGYLGDLRRMFVESVEVNEGGLPRLQPQGQGNVWDL